MLKSLRLAVTCACLSVCSVIVAVAAPYFFIILCLAALVAFPWIPWHFGLRSLFVAITIVAVLMGTIVIWT